MTKNNFYDIIKEVKNGRSKFFDRTDYDSAIKDAFNPNGAILKRIQEKSYGSEIRNFKFEIENLEHPWSNSGTGATYRIEFYAVLKSKNVSSANIDDIVEESQCKWYYQNDSEVTSLTTLSDLNISKFDLLMNTGMYDVFALVYYYTIAGNIHVRALNSAQLELYRWYDSIEDNTRVNDFDIDFLNHQTSPHGDFLYFELSSPYTFIDGFKENVIMIEAKYDYDIYYSWIPEWMYKDAVGVGEKKYILSYLLQPYEVDNLYGDHIMTVDFYYFDENGDFKLTTLNYNFTIKQQGGTDPDTPGGGGGGGGSDPQPQPAPVVTSFKMRKVYLKNLIINSNKGGK